MGRGPLVDVRSMEGLGPSFIHDAHLHCIVVHTVEAHGVALSGLFNEPNSFVQFDSALVVGSYLQLHSRDALRSGFRDTRYEQLLSDALAAILGQYSHAKIPAVLNCMCPSWKDVAPADYSRAIEGYELSGIVLDALADERLNAFKWERLDLGKVLLLPGHGIETRAKALSVRFSDGCDGDLHGA